LRDLFATKSRGAAPSQGAKPDLLGPDALATAAEERAELRAAQVVAVPPREAREWRLLGDGL